MFKKMKTRVVGVLLLSAVLFTLPIGALFANQSMVASVYAEEVAGDEESKEEEKTEEGAGEEVGEESKETVESEEESTDAEETTDSDVEESEEVCNYKEHCSGNYNRDTNCPVCSADYTKCAYENPVVAITMNAPQGWCSDKARITIGVRDTKNTGNFEIVKIEARIGQNGTWQDITEEGYLDITENCSVYVQVTDQNGKLYSKNKNFYCFDRTKPTLNAAVSNGLLTIVGYDNDSGIKAFYVNGYEFKDITNNTINIRLQQFDTGYEYFAIQAMDNTGNMSEVYKTKNPYYDDDPSDDDDKGADTLPKDATTSAPSQATGMVTEHVRTDSQGNTVSPSSQEMQKRASMRAADEAEAAESEKQEGEGEESETGKEFYTIQTQSEKVFYLIIDRDGEEERVYFLTEIDENDLMNTVSTTSETLPKNSAALESAIPSGESAMPNNNVESEVTVADAPVEEPEEVEEVVEEEPTPEPAKQNNFFTYIIMGFIGACAVGAWYYLKMVKGKKEGFLDEDDEEEEEEIYESDEDDSEESGGEEDFFRMDEEQAQDMTTTEEVIEDAAEDVAETIDEE